MAQPQVTEDHSSQGALQLQIQCLDPGGKCALAGDTASEQYLQTVHFSTQQCRVLKMSLFSITSPSKRGSTLCLSLRITALFSTEDGSVLQCSAQQVLCLSLLCFPTCSTLPNPLCCWLNRFGGSGTVFDSGKISRSLQTQVVLLNLFLSLHSDI